MASHAHRIVRAPKTEINLEDATQPAVLLEYILIDTMLVRMCGYLARGPLLGWGARSRSPIAWRRLASAATTGKRNSTAPTIDAREVEDLAAMAHLSLEPEHVRGDKPCEHRDTFTSQPIQPGPTPSQIPEVTRDLKRMLDWFSELRAIDVTGVPPALQADLRGDGHLRSDRVQEFPDRQEGGVVQQLGHAH